MGPLSGNVRKRKPSKPREKKARPKQKPPESRKKKRRPNVNEKKMKQPSPSSFGTRKKAAELKRQEAGADANKQREKKAAERMLGADPTLPVEERETLQAPTKMTVMTALKMMRKTILKMTTMAMMTIVIIIIIIEIPQFFLKQINNKNSQRKMQF